MSTCNITPPNISVDVVAAILFVAAWFWQWSTTSTRRRRWYNEGRAEIPGWTPPGWLFGVVWTILYIALGVSTYLYFRNFCAEPRYTATLWLILANALANKLWSLMFFDWGDLWMVVALWLLLLVILPTAVIVLVFMGLNAAWVSFGLWIAYPVWLLVAVYLNLMWVRLRLPTRDAETLPVTMAAVAEDDGDLTIRASIMQDALAYRRDSPVAAATLKLGGGASPAPVDAGYGLFAAGSVNGNTLKLE